MQPKQMEFKQLTQVLQMHNQLLNQPQLMQLTLKQKKQKPQLTDVLI